MKTTTLIFILFFSTALRAQNRKTLLKEINNYKYTVYEKESLATDTNNLEILIQKYFEKKDFRFALKQNDTLTFIKKVSVTYKSETHDRETHSYKTGKHENGFALFYVLIYLRNSKKQPQQPLIKSYQENLTNIKTRSVVLGRHHFNKIAFYDYLHSNTNKTKIELSLNLLEKINHYNSQQLKEKRKLIAGRDY
mgnify:CR=1 FL=1